MGHMVTLKPFPSGGVPGATRHMAMPELSNTESGSRAAGTHNDTRTLPCRLAGPVPRGLHWKVGLKPWDIWRHWSPSLSGGGPSGTGHVGHQSPPVLGGESRVVGHMATSEPFPVGWRARCHGDTRRHQSPSRLDVESDAIGLDLSLVHGGTRSAGYRQGSLEITLIDNNILVFFFFLN
jgi:hypothetical protein